MSLQERLGSDVFRQLNDLRNQLPQDEKANVFTFEEEESIKEELLKQAEKTASSDEIDDDFFMSLSGPIRKEGDEKKVEVEYLGHVGYVDISFETLDDDLDEDTFQQIHLAIDQLAYSEKQSERQAAMNVIEGFGEKAITVIFRECRKLDLTNEVIRNEVIQLINRIAIRSYKARQVIKAVLEKANSHQHISLAILGAGAVREKEASKSILSRMKNPDHFGIGYDTLLKIRDIDTVEPLLQLIYDIDENKNDVIDQAFRLSHSFSAFGPDAVKPVFDAYISCDKRHIRPILTVALRSFKEDAVPVLMEVFNKETDEAKLRPICITLGGLRLPFATNLLVEAFHKFPNKKRTIITGLSRTKDSSLVPMLLKEIAETSDLRVKAECLNAIAFLAGRDADLVDRNKISSLLSERKNDLYLDAINCLVHLGDNNAFETYFKLLLNGTESEQFSLQRRINTMPPFAVIKMTERILACPDDKAILIVSALRGANVLPQQVGPILLKKLEQNIASALKLEIYRLIGKFVNKEREILSQDVIYKAIEEERDPRVIRELEQIVKNMRKEKGRISTVKN